jgi:hypothetical protein
VISGCNLLDFQARVHAGLVVSWIHKPAALRSNGGMEKADWWPLRFASFATSRAQIPRPPCCSARFCGPRWDRRSADQVATVAA